MRSRRLVVGLAILFVVAIYSASTVVMSAWARNQSFESLDHPLQRFRFGTDEIPEGYRLAPFDEHLAERMTSNPGFQLATLSEEGGIPVVEAIYRSESSTISLLISTPMDQSEIGKFAKTLLGTRSPQLVGVLWTDSSILVAAFSYPATPSAHEIRKIQGALRKMQARLMTRGAYMDTGEPQ